MAFFPPFSKNLKQAFTFGPILPARKCPSLKYCLASLKVKLPQEIFASMNLNIGDEVWLILAPRKLKTITDGE